MRTVGIKNLKDRLSEYVRLAESGEEVLVTERDRVVAELVPPRHDRSPRILDAVLADAVRNGWLSPPVNKSSSLPPRRPVAPLGKILKELALDRSDR